jgi:hypothetical protein
MVATVCHGVAPNGNLPMVGLRNFTNGGLCIVMITTSEFADNVGRKVLASALGINATAVSNAIVKGYFPPSWFVTAKKLADAAGSPCPPELFRMRKSITSPPVKSSAEIQGQPRPFSDPRT